MATVVIFDRTTIEGITRLWLASLALCSAGAFLWWIGPTMIRPRARKGLYEPASLVVATAPLALVSLTLVAVDYLSDSVHDYLFGHFFYRQLLSGQDWPVMLLAVGAVCYPLLWLIRESLLEVGMGTGRVHAVSRSLNRLPSLLPLGLVVLGLLLATASVTTINVNFWRYWATADGWATIGHYPATLTDAYHVEEGNVSKYFISFPLLPSMLTVSFSLLGHTTLGAHPPMILGATLLPLAVFLCVREMTADVLLAFLVACLVGSFPLLRSYTLDVAEADSLLMTMLVLATYFSLWAYRRGTARAHLTAGFAAGVAALARPEGILYMGAMYAAGLRDRWRDRHYWLSAIAFGLIAAGFSAISLHEFGVIWPGNHSNTINPSNVPRTLAVVQESQLLWKYATVLGMSQTQLAAGLCVLLVALLLCTVQMIRRDLRLVFMPMAALGNLVMVFFVGPIPAEATKFQDFFRHISYGFPFLAITLAYGLNQAARVSRGWWAPMPRVVVAVGLAWLTLVGLSILAGPVTPGAHVNSPIMTSDVHFTAPTLLTSPYPLPVTKFQLSESRYVPDEHDYMAVYPDEIRAHYAPADVRLTGNAIEYYRAAQVVFLGFLAMYGLSLLPTTTRWRVVTSAT